MQLPSILQIKPLVQEFGVSLQMHLLSPGTHLEYTLSQTFPVIDVRVPHVHALLIQLSLSPHSLSLSHAWQSIVSRDEQSSLQANVPAPKPSVSQSLSPRSLPSQTSVGSRSE